MSVITLVAAVLTAATFCIHVFSGGPEIHRPIQNSALAPILRCISAVLWHGISIVLLVFALALAWMAWHPNLPLAVTMIVIQLGFAGLFLYYGLRITGSVWPAPQWVIFIGLSGLIAWGQV